MATFIGGERKPGFFFLPAIFRAPDFLSTGFLATIFFSEGILFSGGIANLPLN